MSDADPHSKETEIAALFERLRTEIARRPAGVPDQLDGAADASAYDAARDEAERFRAVTADRPFLYKPGAVGRARGFALAPAKAVLRKLMRWYVEPALAQQRDFNSRALRVIDAISERLDANAAELVRFKRDADHASASLAGVESSLAEADQRLIRLERWMRRANGGQTAVASEPHATAVSPAEPDYFAFESRMRGPIELIGERQTVYLDDFHDAAPVLDIGCGRGEFLALLRDAGVEARGIDLDADMVAHCLDEGLDVEQADALTYLAGLDDGSLGGIFCAHLLEHLSAGALFGLLDLAAQKLRPNGVFVSETPNPLSLVALANFSADLSHKAPLHPATLSFLVRQAGFGEVTLRFLSEPPEDERLRLVPVPDVPGFGEVRAILDADINRLNDVVFGPQDYAVVARL